WAWRRAGITPAQHWALVISLLMILAVCWSSSAVVWEGDRDVRTKHIIPALSLAVILFAALFAHSLNLFKDARLRLALGIAIPLIVLTPQVAQTVEFVQYSRQENSNVVVRQWADENLPPGRVLVNRFNMNTFNPDWGGIPHRHWFDWWITEDFTGVSPAEWRARGMTYMLLPYHERENLLQTAEGRAYLDQMLLLRDFPASPSRHG